MDKELKQRVRAFAGRLFIYLGSSVFALPGSSAMRVDRIVQIPAQPREKVVAMVSDSQNNTIVAGWIIPSTFPSPAIGFVRKQDPGGNTVFSRTLPGVPFDTDVYLAVDSKDDVYVTSRTFLATQFPFTARLNTPAPGVTPGETAFVMKLRGGDGAIAYSTALGAGIPGGVAVDRAGRAIVIGATFSRDFVATPGAYSTSYKSSLTNLAYFVVLSPAGDAGESAGRFGGNANNCQGGSACSGFYRSTYPSALALDSGGNIYISGFTNATDVPVTPNAIQKTCGCSNHTGDGFVAKFSPDGSQLLYATYLGTSFRSPIDFLGNDLILSMALDTNGNIWLAGRTNGKGFPVTADAPQPQYSGDYDGFIAELDPSGSNLLFFTYFGGDAEDAISNLAIAPDGTVLISGDSDSTSLPGNFSGFARGSGFVAALNPLTHSITDGTRLLRGAAGTGLSVAPDGAIQVTGASHVITRLRFSALTAPNLAGVANSAGDAASGQVAPGELISVYGSEIGPAQPAAADFKSGQAPIQLGGVQVLIDGVPVPLLYAQSDQINAIVPFSVAGKPAVRLTITGAGATSNEALLGVVPAMPSVLKQNPTRFWAAALNEDGSVNGPDLENKARLGTIVSVFASGAGDLDPRPADGEVTEEATARLVLPVQVLYDGKLLEITYAGPAPMLVAGVTQINFRLPSFTGTSEPVFSLKAGDWEGGGFVVLVKQ